ncbi:DNA polymerase III, chi subunit [Limimonas halophila]|uniref:DNA polymerase III, chi subunit n=1 Tax=Limimonas halophila TaxID=1082479 RepID=A0A1G7P968_9PROT|nr:DNA polymerase III subunit chi [Limimonas halophila]SDF82855.1 DNA polymerase III, chi subunit [Limimonas halophila]
MTEVRFYHLTRTTLEAALPQLVRKVLERDMRAVIMAGTNDRVEALTELLWAFDQASFLPHGSRKDGYPEHQPVYLTNEDTNPNGASVLFLVDGMATEQPETFQIVAELFDGGDEDAVATARQRWKQYKRQGFTLTYWQQDQQGRWHKGA